MEKMHYAQIAQWTLSVHKQKKGTGHYQLALTHKVSQLHEILKILQVNICSLFPQNLAA